MISRSCWRREGVQNRLIPTWRWRTPNTVKKTMTTSQACQTCVRFYSTRRLCRLVTFSWWHTADPGAQRTNPIFLPQIRFWSDIKASTCSCLSPATIATTTSPETRCINNINASIQVLSDGHSFSISRLSSWKLHACSGMISWCALLPRAGIHTEAVPTIHAGRNNCMQTKSSFDPASLNRPLDDKISLPCIPSFVVNWNKSCPNHQTNTIYGMMVWCRERRSTWRRLHSCLPSRWHRWR